MDRPRVTETRCVRRREHTHHHLVVAVAHVDGVLGGHHVPQAVAAQDDVAVARGVKGHHGRVGLGGDHELPAVEVVAPEVSLTTGTRGRGDSLSVSLLQLACYS